MNLIYICVPSEERRGKHRDGEIIIIIIIIIIKMRN